MKRTAFAAAAALTLLGACGVDKDGTADNLIKELEKAGITLDADEKSCVKDAVKSYSDDDLRKLSENKASDELTAEFGTKLLECGVGG